MLITLKRAELAYNFCTLSVKKLLMGDDKYPIVPSPTIVLVNDADDR